MEAEQMIEAAEALARRAHAGQVDKAGAAYIDHPRRVAQRAAELAPAELRTAAVTAAWLHDVVEDTPVTLEQLRMQGFSAEVVDAVERLTKGAGQAAEEYFAGIRQSPIAMLVKSADLLDNTSAARVRKLDERTRARLAAKYERSWALLRGERRAGVAGV